MVLVPSMPPSAPAASDLLSNAVARQVFPGAVAEVGSAAGVMWRDVTGHLTFDAGTDPIRQDTIFDLASLTKPIATTTAALSHVARGGVGLDTLVREQFVEWQGADRAAVSLRHLLDHSSGLAARLPGTSPTSAREFLRALCTGPLAYLPGTRAEYSDLGFILLGLWIEALGRQALSTQVQDLCSMLLGTVTGDPDDLLLTRVPPSRLGRVAPTRPLSEDRRTGVLRGEVHDPYAHELGGFAGHAGLFGTVGGVGAFARYMLALVRGEWQRETPVPAALARTATTRSRVPGSSRGLGWDTMLPTSSCGARLSATAFGHVGFTGTSLWIDPDRNRYYVLLTNRAWGEGTTQQMQDIRRAFHDAVADL